MIETTICRWWLDDEELNVWATECCEYFILEDGGPKENNMCFCPFCGLPIIVADDEVGD